MTKVARLASLLFVTLLAASPVAFAQFHLARLQYLSRSGAQVGETFDLSVHGERLEEVVELRFSNPAIKAAVKTLDPLPFSKERRTHPGHFTVQIPDDISAGRYEVRAVGRHGITNSRAFLITDLVHHQSTPPSHDQNSPNVLPIDQIVHGTVAAKETDWYAIEVTEGNNLFVQLLANRLDSALIGQLGLYGPDKRKVHSVRGSDELDLAMSTQGLAAGTYTLGVRDFMHRGGPEFHYQILIREAGTGRPLIKPVADASGQLAMYWLPRAATLADVTNFDHPSITDQTTRSIEPPADITSYFTQIQSDYAYQFNAAKGQKLAIDVISQRLLEPTDPRLIIERVETQADGDPKLHHLLHVDDSPNVTDGVIRLGSKDPETVFLAPRDATYRLSIRDLDIGTTLAGAMLRSGQKYRLRVGPPNPRFDLVAYRVFPAKDTNAARPFSSKLFRGGAEMIRVFALRRDGWSGEIRIAVEGLPDGVTCEDAMIAANQDKTQLTLVASEQAVGHTGSIRVVGHSTDGDLVSPAVPVMIARARGHGRGAVRNRVTTTLPIHVSELDLSPLTLTLGDGNIAEVKPGESLSLPIRMVRREGGKTPAIFRPINFPPGVAAGEVTIAADATEGKIELKPNAATKPGTYSIWLQAETKIKVRSNPQALERDQAYRAKLQSLHDDPAQAANLESIDAAIVEADKRVEAAKGQANEQELTVFIPTNHATIRVVQP